jgi:non-ribosomal peptide synthetase component E (peptide arylation enzyme)
VTYAAESDAAQWLATGDWVASTVGDALRSVARERPHKAAFVSGEQILTFGGLDALSDRLAAALVLEGLDVGDRVIVQLGTTLETAVVVLALYKAGLIPVCAVPQYREIEIGQLARLSGAKGYIVQDDFSGFDLTAFAKSMLDRHESLERLFIMRGRRPELGASIDDLIDSTNPGDAAKTLAKCRFGPGDVLSFQLSGGTTGIPKIIPRFHAEYLGQAAAWMRRFEIGPSARLIWPLPLLHNAGQLFAFIPTLLLGLTTVLLPRLDVPEMLEMIEREQVTHALSIGPVAAQLFSYAELKRHDLSSLEMFGTMSNAHALEQHIGVPCVNFYGITEGMVLGSGPRDPVEIRHGTHGISGAFSDEIRLVDPETGRLLPPGSAGEFAFRGPSSLRGYFGAPEATAEVLTADGFFRSGDIMRPVEAGGRTAYSFQGRTRDNINRGGEKVGCEEVETLVATHLAVAEVCLVPMPDAIYGEKGCIFVIPRPGADAPSVVEFVDFLVGKGLAKFKCPERVETIAEFPLTRVGKLDRGALKRMIAEKLAWESQQTTV